MTKYFAARPDSDCPAAPSIDSRTRYLEVLHEFALSQVNLNSLDEILWNVAKTAIAKLGFVDPVRRICCQLSDTGDARANYQEVMGNHLAGRGS